MITFSLLPPFSSPALFPPPFPFSKTIKAAAAGSARIGGGIFRNSYSTLFRKSLVRCWVGWEKISSGEPSSTICPSSINSTRSATSRAKPISWVTTAMVMPSRARRFITSSTSPTISGSRAEVGSSKSITSGSMHRARTMAMRCFCPPES